MATAALGLSDKQIDLRRSGIGASEAPDIVLAGGIATYARKVGEADEFQGSSLTEFGHRLEPVLAQAYVDRHPGIRVYTPGTLRHSEHDWALATLDRVEAPPGIGRPARKDWIRNIEIKVSFFSSGEYGEGADDIPERFVIQTQWQMEVADLARTTLVALVNGDYREYEIERDREMGALLLDVVGRFWRENVLARVPPPVTGSDAYTSYLRRRHPRDTVPALPATPELADLVARVRETKEALKQAEVFEAEAVNQLRALLGDAAGVEGLCTYRSNKDSTKIDWEGIAKVLNPDPAMIAQFTTTRPGARVLRLSKEK